MTCLSEAIITSFPPPRGTREHPESYRLWKTAQDQEIRRLLSKLLQYFRRHYHADDRRIYDRPTPSPAQNACKNTKGGNTKGGNSKGGNLKRDNAKGEAPQPGCSKQAMNPPPMDIENDTEESDLEDPQGMQISDYEEDE